ncbi:MAG: hypothetical protein ABW224_12670 [Kibdelosporangium sp.]
MGVVGGCFYVRGSTGIVFAGLMPFGVVVGRILAVTTRTVVPVGLWALRVAGIMFLAAVLAQAVFAGLFVTGEVEFLDMHAVNANVIVFAVVLWIVASLVVRAPRRVVVGGVVALAVSVAQVGVGFARILPLHIPIGVAMFAMGVRLVQLAFSYHGERE